MNTVFPIKNATSFITKSNFWVRHLVEGGVYHRAVFSTNGGVTVRRSIEGLGIIRGRYSLEEIWYREIPWCDLICVIEDFKYYKGK